MSLSSVPLLLIAAAGAPGAAQARQAAPVEAALGYTTQVVSRCRGGRAAYELYLGDGGSGYLGVWTALSEVWWDAKAFTLEAKAHALRLDGGAAGAGVWLDAAAGGPSRLVGRLAPLNGACPHEGAENLGAIIVAAADGVSGVVRRRLAFGARCRKNRVSGYYNLALIETLSVSFPAGRPLVLERAASAVFDSAGDCRAYRDRLAPAREPQPEP